MMAARDSEGLPAPEGESRLRATDASGDAGYTNVACWVKEHTIGIRHTGRLATAPGLGIRQP
jgi:hypothetical protein